MRKWIYVMFVLEYTVPDKWTGSRLVQEVHEECFSNKAEMKNYIKTNFKNSEEFEYIEKYKGSKKTDITYIFRVVYH